LEEYGQKLEEVKAKTENAGGQQEASQAGNQIATKEVELLAMIHALLLEQNQMLTSMNERNINEEERRAKGDAIITRDSGTLKKIFWRGGEADAALKLRALQ
jgi:conjugal transfer/entry exclusion protein